MYLLSLREKYFVMRYALDNGHLLSVKMCPVLARADLLELKHLVELSCAK